MAIKYLAGDRITGTAAERVALTVVGGAWTQGGSETITMDTSTPFTIRNNRILILTISGYAKSDKR